MTTAADESYEENFSSIREEDAEDSFVVENELVLPPANPASPSRGTHDPCLADRACYTELCGAEQIDWKNVNK